MEGRDIQTMNHTLYQIKELLVKILEEMKKENKED